MDVCVRMESDNPPANNTFPLCRRVAVWAVRVVFIGLICLHFRDFGEKISADL